MMKYKVAIITHYYQSINYGGNLQAYALPKFLNNHGYNAVQICYPFGGDYRGLSRKEKILHYFKTNPFNLFSRAYKEIKYKIYAKTNYEALSKIQQINSKRQQSFSDFQNNFIPHTGFVYNEKNLHYINDDFDFFITGSDQVFNYSCFREAFWLTFANKPKFSYAASMAMDYIPKDKVNFTVNALKQFKNVGVREEKTVELLNNLNVCDINLNIDPTFLLNSDEWDKVSSERLIDEEYLFCYFLGNNKTERILAEQYAKEKKLKIVCIPANLSIDNLSDLNFGDINMPYASPQDFVSLIKYAKVVFTDSFHACAFSIIYNINFLVFNRDDKGTMSSRIVSIMNLFNVSERFLSSLDLCTMNYVRDILSKGLVYDRSKFLTLYEKSVKYLLSNLH